MNRTLAFAKRKAATVLALLGLVVGTSLVGIASAPAASAADYGVNFAAACRLTYNGPQYYAINIFGGPYGWTCAYSTYGFPLAVTVIRSAASISRSTAPSTIRVVGRWWSSITRTAGAAGGKFRSLNCCGALSI